MSVKLRSEITDIQVIAVGRAIRILSQLEKAYGKGRWRKLKGTALVELPDGSDLGRRYTGTKHTALAAEI
jgi:hypothetical protein